MDDVAIRPTTAADDARLALVGAATFLETYAGVLNGNGIVSHCAAAHAPAAYAAYREGGATAWLAEHGGAPIGYALTCAPALDAAGAGDRELRRIYLLSRYHGTGLAARLLDTVIAAAAGHARMLVAAKDDNARAIAFYTRHGFAAVGTRRFDVGGTLYDDVVLARPI